MKHQKLSEAVEGTIKDSKYVPTSDKDLVEICYPAIIQSGGSYNLKFSAQSDKNNLHFGTIICALGFRFKNYCSNIVRTLLVDPTEKIQENYKYLLSLEEELINSLKDGKFTRGDSSPSMGLSRNWQDRTKKFAWINLEMFSLKNC